jgi:ubiquinone/menaquinone biosynthesis C-methylase UbiE
MPEKFDTRRRHELLSDERHEALQPESLLRKLGLKRGDTMADIGSGPGFFTVPAAEIVGPEGLVLAADVQGEMLSAVKSRVTDKGLTNVRVVKTSDTEVPIPPETCDFVLLAFVLNEIGQRASFLHRMGRLLRPGGRIVVLEWYPREQADFPPADQRIPQDVLLEDAHSAGLRVDSERDLNDDQYLYVFTRSKR